MKKLLTCTFAILALASIAIPTLADGPEAVTAVQTGAAPEPLFLKNGPPAEFPGRGNSCRIPPPFRPDPCICIEIFQPVCGCNGVTYANACFAACEVRTFTEGACEGSGFPEP
jgi:hypothetical protein